MTASTSTASSAGYLLDLVTASRDPAAAGMNELAPLIAFGASPRATLFLARAAKAMALLARARLRHPGRRQGDRAGRPAPPRRPDLRSRSPESLQRRPRRTAPRPRRGPVSHRRPDVLFAARALEAPGRRGTPNPKAADAAGSRRPDGEGAADRDLDPPPGRPGRRRDLSLGFQGPRHGVRRGASLPAGRRRPHDRLEPSRLAWARRS